MAKLIKKHKYKSQPFHQYSKDQLYRLPKLETIADFFFSLYPKHLVVKGKMIHKHVFK